MKKDHRLCVDIDEDINKRCELVQKIKKSKIKLPKKKTSLDIIRELRAS